MASTFIGLEMGKRSLITEQTAIKTSGHNISNANTEGYTRQRVTRQTEIPLYDPSLSRAERPGQIGQGVEVSKIERLRNHFIDDRLMDEKANQGFWKTKNDYLYHIELIHNEPDDKNIRSLMDSFWNSWEELANNPTENSVREVVRERANTLTNSINHTYHQLWEMQKNVNHDIKVKIDEFNDMTESIRQLNVQIKRSENLGDRPNDLYDRRDLLVEKLSKMAGITVGRSDSDEFIVYLGNRHVVQGEHAEKIVAVEDGTNKGYYTLQWNDTQEQAQIKTGEIGALFELRDYHLDYQIRELNNLSINLADLTNEIHRDGFDLNNNTNINFFHNLPITQQANGDFDRNNDGINESTALFKIAGTQHLNLDDTIGINGIITLDSNTPGGNPITVSYNQTDTVRDVIKKINNSQSEVVAYLNNDNQLTFKATLSSNKQNPDFVIRHLEDSGNFLVGYSGILKQAGVAGAYDWNTTGQTAQLQSSPEDRTITPMYNPASWMRISDAIKLDTRSIATAKGTDYTGNNDADRSNGVGDGSNALEIANLRYKKTMFGKNETLNDYYTAVISKIGTEEEQADVQIKTSDKLVENLKSLRDSFSGVNLDEEMANLIAFQQAYNASARFITIQDRMLDTLIRMGL